MSADQSDNKQVKKASSLEWLIILLMASGSLTTVTARPKQASANQLNPGDIVYADCGDAITGGMIIKVDPLTGSQTVLSSGGNLIQPFDLAFDPNGAMVVSDSCGRLIRVVPETGLQSLLADNSSGSLGMPRGISLDRRGRVFVANTESIIRVEPSIGRIQTVSSGGSFVAPIGVAIGAADEIFVLNTGGPAKQIIQVNPHNGGQQVISEDGYFINPQALTVIGSDLYVTDVATSDGNFGIGRVLRVNVQTGAQEVIAEGGYLVGPVGIAGDLNGNLIVADPYTINPMSADLYDGAIIRIDPITGDQTLLARGQGNHVNPRGIAIVGSN